jgi:Carboxypeptidase regulatory-like domain
MRKFLNILTLLLIIVFSQSVINAQTAGSIAGTVNDQNGAVVPNATVTVKGESGQEFTVTTNSNGIYNIPAVASGFYTVTVSSANFKSTVIQNVKVDVGTPATVDAVLEVGKVDETVVVTGGAEILQTQTATVGTTITGRQILETPIQSRDALDLITTLPGTATVGAVRTSSINGLPKSALTIQIDGVDVQDNFLKSSDGFFTFIRPRIDAIDEVTVSTANPGAESSGDGAVGIRFATRRGTDSYKGSAFWQHRDESLNATNFQSNYLNQGKQKLRLNQFGASFGGAIPFLNFGDGVPAFDSGKGKRFFFVNYERFHLNEQSPIRQRQVLTSEAQSGIFRYGTNGANTVNLFNLAAAATTPLPNTIDPTVAGVLTAIRASTGIRGSFSALGTGGVYFRQPFNFANSGQQRRNFLVVRTDFNITNDHALEVIFNNQPFRSNVDFLNSVDPAFPDFANAGTQQSDRRSLSIGLRSNFGTNVVNQFRYAQLAGWLGGASNFDLVGGIDFFNNLQRGYSLTLGAGLTNPTIRNAFSSRVSPTEDFTNNLTWITGNHTFTFGGQLKRIRTISDSTGQIVPTVTFGVVATDSAVLNAFTTTTLPGANATEVANAQALYATLTGRVSAFGSSGVLGADGKYTLNGSRFFEIQENTNGLFAQDSWRIRNNLTINYGVRWQPSLGARMNTANYSVLTDPNAIYDVSGVNNQFSPGTLSGSVPRVRGIQAGEKAFRDDYNNFAPSIGVVWSPEGREGFLGAIFGNSGDSVFRGGFSRAFIREGTLIVENSLGLHPGGSFSLARSTALNNLTVGSLFRTPGNPNIVAPTFNATPVYPRTLTGADAAFSFADDFRTGYVDSFSFGYQRQIGNDTVVEVRYVGNRGKDMQNQYNLNEVNAIENGFGAEFALAQQNLLANIAAGRGANFRYFGAGTGTSPLPIIVSYFAGTNADPNATGSYAGTLFANTTFVNQLSPASPNVLGFASTVEGNFRANGTTPGTFVPNGRPLNFFNNCPTTLGACFLFDNSETSSYDAAVIEVRRRISNGVRFQASYTFGKAFTNAYASANTSVFGLGAGDQSNATNKTLRNTDLDNSTSQVDVRHAFKFDATIDLPFGKGKTFLSSNNWFSNAFFGGWSITPILRWQSGSPILLENVQLVGMSAKDLQKSIGVYYNQTILNPNGTVASVAPVTYLPADIINNTIRAFTTTGLTTNGYNAGSAPSGSFIAPAGYNNCQQRAPGQCGFRKLVLYGPSFFKLDSSVQKRIAIGEKRNIEMRATFFDVLNKTNWRLGGWTGNVNNITAFTGTFGQMLPGWSYQDPNGSNDPGGRIMDLMVRINF